MTGRGKESEGQSKGGAKRHSEVLGNSMQGITKQLIRHLARSAEAMRISRLAYDKIREVLKVFLWSVTRDAMAICVRREGP
ncbi:unnamed protein product [Angiostrongylus costaricensis]|uniref:Histone H4 n=1 Tax=Angiostrongylus costaricensis TaxID=334426 RepID=A0A0R3PX34_ANGCS|nr:unnamed protein product [Angiostrongylus costaricensis]